MKLAGDTPAQADTAAADVLRIETALARASVPREQLRDPDNIYHPTPVAELSTLTPDFAWTAFFKETGAPEFARLNVATPGFFKSMDALIVQEPLPALKNYLRFQTMEKLVANRETALHDDIAGLPWMSEPTRAEAERKLSQFRQKIGYPDHWRDYSGITVERADWFGDSHRAAVFNNLFDIGHIGKPVDESLWGMTPPTVNAYYNGSMNDINFPAGILQPPFYQFSIDPAVNYGAIGVVIGHEMTHAFDDEGSRFDGLGNKRDWFTPEDRARFNEKTSCEVKEYGSFEPLSGQKLNGKLTLGENTADNGGVRIAYAALEKAMAAEPAADRTRKIDGFTPDQRFFLSYAQVWCENTAPALQQQLLKSDPHSPGEFRTNGVVQNFDQFGKAFGCHTGQPMMLQTACRIW